MNLRQLPKPCLAAALAASVATTGVLAGCGGDDETTTATTPTIQPVPTDSTPGSTTATSTAPAPAPPATKPVGGNKKVAIPDLAGSQVGGAQASLGKLGLSGRAETLTGGRTEIKPDWDVCETHPAAGKRVAPGSPITLITAKPGGC